MGMPQDTTNGWEITFNNTTNILWTWDSYNTNALASSTITLVNDGIKINPTL